MEKKDRKSWKVMDEENTVFEIHQHNTKRKGGERQNPDGRLARIIFKILS